MPLHWMDVNDLSFLTLLLLEREQIAWFPNWRFPEPELYQALAANPTVAWFLSHKCPEAADWVAQELETARAMGFLGPPKTPEEQAEVRRCELRILDEMQDLLVYALDPAIYDAQPFLQWDSHELTGLVDFSDKTVIDVGAGTGRLAFVAAAWARTVYAVEPVGNLRHYLRQQARQRGYTNFYAVDGLVTAIPFPDGFADVVMGGHVFGDDPPAECAEMLRVTRPGGMVILCPGNSNTDNVAHTCLVENGFQWQRFEEPHDGPKRKYWKLR